MSDYLTIDEAAAIVGLDRVTFMRRVRSRQLARYSDPTDARRYVILRSDLPQLMQPTAWHHRHHVHEPALPAYEDSTNGSTDDTANGSAPRPTPSPPPLDFTDHPPRVMHTDHEHPPPSRSSTPTPPPRAGTRERERWVKG